MTPFPTALLYLVLGVGLVVAIVTPRMFRSLPVSSPIVLLVMGVVLGLLPFTEPLVLSERDENALIQHATELTVLVSLMGAGLAIDRPLSFRDRGSWGRWRSTWLMLAVAMPLGIAGVFVLGTALGVAPATALLLAAVLAPTDPVLASEVQVEGPNAGRRAAAEEADGPVDEEGITEREDVDDEEHEVRFVLTSEASLNDGLAFPFVYAALFLASGAVGTWIGGWLAWELVGKIAVGVGVGIALGWLLGWLAFNAPYRSLRVAETGESLMALAAVLLTYGVAEAVNGYGFLAVTAAALTFRTRERTDRYHKALHEVIEQLELLLTLFIMLGLGFAIARGVLSALDWRSFVLVGFLMFIGRPIPALLALRGDRRTTRGDRWVIAFFGIRGIGSIYYMAYALAHGEFAEASWLWATVALAIAASVIIHGTSATPALAWLDEQNERRAARKRSKADARTAAPEDA